MNYVYDILINYHKNLYDFYDWNLDDEIIHIRKTPVFKVNTKTISDFRQNFVKFNNEFLIKINNKTETFNEKNTKKIKYAFLVSDGIDVLSLKLNDKGKIIGISKLMIDEEQEIVEMICNLKTINIDYCITNSRVNNSLKTRSELKQEKYINEQFIKIEKENQFDKLKYLYYECFGKKEDDKSIILDDIKRELKTNFVKWSNKLYDFFKLTSLNK